MAGVGKHGPQVSVFEICYKRIHHNDTRTQLGFRDPLCLGVFVVETRQPRRKPSVEIRTLAANRRTIVEPGDHGAFEEDGRRERVVQGGRFGQAEGLILRTNPPLIARNSDLIPNLYDVFCLFMHSALLLGSPSAVVPETSGANPNSEEFVENLS